MTPPIDWETVDKEFADAQKKEQFVNEQIAKERKTIKTVEQLIEDAKIVNKAIKNNNFNSKILTPKKSEEE